MANANELLNPTQGSTAPSKGKPSWDQFANYVNTHLLNRPDTPGDDSGTEIDFDELKDGTLVELVEDSKDADRACLAVWKDGEARLVDRLERDGQVFIPLPRKNEILRHVRLPKGVLPYESVQALLSRLECLISQCVDVDEKYLPVLADFVLSTWFVDQLPVAPYLSVVGLPQSGKTTLLRVLSLVCRRALLIADITPASFYHACARFMPTMLIDEARSVSCDRILRLLRSGTTRDVLAVRNNRTFYSYGAKVISWLEPPDDPALNSRCVLISMAEGKNATLVSVDEPQVQQSAADLQAQLLRFRFENYKKLQLGRIPGDEILRPRTRDILLALSAAHAHDAKRSERLLEFFQSGQGVPPEPLGPEQNAVLGALFAVTHLQKGFSSMRVGDLTRIVNLFLARAGEHLRLPPRKVGAVLTSLHCCTRTRTNSGRAISVNRQDAEKLHQLAARYGLDGFADECLSISPNDCRLCQKAGLNKERVDAATPRRPDLDQETLNILNSVIKYRYSNLTEPQGKTHRVLRTGELEVKKKVFARQRFSPGKAQARPDAGKRKHAA